MRISVQLVNQSAVGQSCARGLPVSALSSEFCTVQVLERPKNLSIKGGSTVYTFWVGYRAACEKLVRG